MGIPNNKEYATEALKKYFQENFPVFRDKFRTEFIKWSATPIVKEMCEGINIYVTLYFQLNDIEKSIFLIVGNDCLEIKENAEIQDCLKNKEPNMHMEQIRYSNIENTELGSISSFFLKPAEIVWSVSFKEYSGKNVHKIVAKVILKLLEENIHDLNKFQKNNDCEIKEYFKDRVFMNYYVQEMKKSFVKVPDNELITKVSLTGYENRKSCGTVCFLNDISSVEKEMIHFDESNRLQDGFNNIANAKGIRKLLEICRDSENCLAVSAQSGEIIGILPGNTELKREQNFSICFDGNKWELCSGSETLLKYQSGVYYIDTASEEEELREKCNKAEVSYEIFGELFKLLEDKASHGALIIIAEDAETETTRLCTQFGRGIKVSNCTLNKKMESEIEGNPKENAPKKAWLDEANQMVLGMTNADGAIIFDYAGNCYGFNIILDGIASVRGDISSGSRYNSAVNYIAYDNIKATKQKDADNIKRCAVVRSEDKEKGLKIISNTQLRDM